MQRFPIQSSAMSAVGYDKATLTLEIEYKPNAQKIAAVWQYSPVPEWLAQRLVAPGSSAGSVLAEIKNSDVTAIQVGVTMEPTSGDPINVASVQTPEPESESDVLDEKESDEDESDDVTPDDELDTTPAERQAPTDDGMLPAGPQAAS